MNAKTFKPTYAMIETAKTVFLAMAWEQTVRPIVEGYKKEILSFYQFKNIRAEKWGMPEIVTDPNHSYCLDEEDFKVYFAECKKAMAKAGLKVQHEDNCPLLEAESVTRGAKWELAKVMQGLTGIEVDRLRGHLDLFNQYIELNLKLLAPYVDTKETLKSIKAVA